MKKLLLFIALVAVTVGATAQTTVGVPTTNTTVQGAAISLNSTYLNVTTPGAVTVTTPNLQLNGSEKITGNLEVKGYTTLSGPNTTIGAGSSVTNLNGHNTIVGSTYTSLNSSQTFVNGEKTEFRQGVGSSKTLTTISQTGISTAGSVSGAQIFTQGMEVGNEIINLKNGVNSKASASSVIDLTNTVNSNATIAANATAAVQTNLDAYKVSNDAAVALKADKSQVDALETKVTSEVTRLDSRINDTNTNVSNLTNTVNTNATIAATATARVQTNLDAEATRAKAAEKALDTKIDQNAETAKLYTDKETTRAMDAESKLGKRIDALDIKFDNRINSVMTYVGNEFAAVNNRLEGLGASMAALSAAATSSVYNANKPTNLNIGTGVYGKSTAIAVGMSHFFNSSTKVSVNWSQGSNTKNAVGIGCGIAF